MKPLRFIHISKTGGQAIAMVARNQAQIEWGMFDKQYISDNTKLRKDDHTMVGGPENVHHQNWLEIDPNNQAVYKCGNDVPSCHMLLSNIQQYETIDQYDWFMVVRNPYERFVSLYNWDNMRQKMPYNMGQQFEQIIGQNMPYHMGQQFEQKMKQNICSNTRINEYLRSGFQHISVGKNCVGCYYTEQYRYLDPKCNIRILRYENLEEEFNQLMKDYEHNIVLNIKHNTSIKIASLSDLTLETIESINSIYEKDFTTFHYEMRHSIFEKEESKNKDITPH